MSTRHLLTAAGAVVFTIIAIAILFAAPTVLAANDHPQTNFTNAQSVPPAQGPTLIPQTPNFNDLPPIDLGPLNAESTPVPTATVAPEGQTNTVVENSFDACDTIDDDYFRIECKDGQMHFTRKETRGTRYLYYRPNLTDALIEVTARLPNGNKNARYGVIFRLSDDFKNYYILGVTNDGKYGLFRFAEDHYETLIPYTDDFNVGNASFPTKIKIVNQGDVIAINLGGQWVASVRDENLKAGRVALFTEPDEANQTILFDDLKISEILSPLAVPEPRAVEPAVTPTTAGSDFPVFNFDATPTTAAAPTNAPQPTQTPFIIIVTATPQPTAIQPTRVPTRRPTQAACEAGANEAILYISNNYQNTTMRFTIGGGEWGTHDYDVPGDGKWYIIRMPPGTYTYTASIAGLGTAHGEKKEYLKGQCYDLRFSP